jgi:hypothetical protein
MGWLREHGLIASLDDYERLPAGVLFDARLVMEAEAAAQKMRRTRA